MVCSARSHTPRSKLWHKQWHETQSRTRAGAPESIHNSTLPCCRAAGHRLGTVGVCAEDPRDWTAEQCVMLANFGGAGLIHITFQRRYKSNKIP